jgi:GntR family transcriptional regulator, transcriptional repressor for pyruvate dehydrogenase complex
MGSGVSVLSPIDKSNAYEAAQRELIKLVVASSLKVGDRLPSEADMASELGVSRPVVREALGSLRALGLIDSIKGRGTFVAAPKASLLTGRYSLREVFEARVETEGTIARLAAQRLGEESRRVLAGVLKSMGSCSDPKEWAELDWQFHSALALATGNGVLVEFSEHLRGSVNYMSMSLWGAARNRQAYAEHRAIFAALKEGDEQAAAEAMQAHLDAVHKEIIRIYGPNGWERPAL